MVEHIFDVNDIASSQQQPITYNLDPSPHIQSIRNIIVKRYAAKKRRLSTSSNNKINHRPLKKKHIQQQQQQKSEDLLMVHSGLPSPPVESPVNEFPPQVDMVLDDQQPPVPVKNDKETINASVTLTTQSPKMINNMTASDINKKLEDLKQEKHRLFQLIKLLMQQEHEKEQLKQQQQTLMAESQVPQVPVTHPNVVTTSPALEVDNDNNKINKSSPWSVNENDSPSSSSPQVSLPVVTAATNALPPTVTAYNNNRSSTPSSSSSSSSSSPNWSQQRSPPPLSSSSSTSSSSSVSLSPPQQQLSSTNEHPYYRRVPSSSVYGRPFNNNNKRSYNAQPTSLNTPSHHQYSPRYFHPRHQQRPLYRSSYPSRDYAPQSWSSSPVQP